MKWTNKGHEFDRVWEMLDINENEPLYFYIFGAGVIGRSLCKSIIKNLQKLKINNVIRGFIDNDVNKQGAVIDNIDVISLDEYLSLGKGKILLAAKQDFLEQMENQLKKHGLKRGKDYFFGAEFCCDYFPLISTYYYNKNYISFAQISLTERCTLKCKHCAHGCFAVDRRKSNDLTIEQVKKSADYFFHQVDYVYKFTLLGGEPLLYSNLVEAIIYIGEKYRNQIDIFYITTNGTLLPNESVIEVCKKYNVSFEISDYTNQVPRLKQRLEKFTEILSKNEINYSILKEEFEWIDFGFQYVKNEDSELISIFDKCKTVCREIRENRYYYCVMARSTSENLGLGVGEEDYLDLDLLQGDDSKKIFFEFSLGYSNKGYLDMCKYCNSMASNVLVPPGEQIE